MGSRFAVTRHLIIPFLLMSAFFLARSSRPATFGEVRLSILRAVFHPGPPSGETRWLRNTPMVDLPEPYGPVMDIILPLLEPARPDENRFTASTASALGTYRLRTSPESCSMLVDAYGFGNTPAIFASGVLLAPDSCLCVI